MTQYIQTQKVLWAASLIAQDWNGNQTERGFRVMAQSIQEAMQLALEQAEGMAECEGWELWMLYDIGIIPDDCFN